MMVLRQNMVKMKFARHTGTVPVYEKGPDGETVYFTDGEGMRHPVETGEYRDAYGSLTDFAANISRSNGKGHPTEYGMANSDFDAVLVMQKGIDLLRKGDYVWVNSPVEYADGEEETVIPESADYIVVGVPDSLNVRKVLLKSVNREGTHDGK